MAAPLDPVSAPRLPWSRPRHSPLEEAAAPLLVPALRRIAMLASPDVNRPDWRLCKDAETLDTIRPTGARIRFAHRWHVLHGPQRPERELVHALVHAGQILRACRVQPSAFAERCWALKITWTASSPDLLDAAHLANTNYPTTLTYSARRIRNLVVEGWTARALVALMTHCTEEQLDRYLEVGIELEATRNLAVEGCLPDADTLAFMEAMRFGRPPNTATG